MHILRVPQMENYDSYEEQALDEAHTQQRVSLKLG